MEIHSFSKDFDFLQDIEPPTGKIITAKYKKSFAYKSITDHLPALLTTVIDSLCKKKDELLASGDFEKLSELNNIIDNVHALKMDIQLNKPLVPLKEVPGKIADDAQIWNNKIEMLKEQEGEIKTWFNTTLFIAETYMYRRLAQEFLLTSQFIFYDPFEAQKQEAYFKALNSINYLSDYMIDLLNSNKNLSLEETRKFFMTMIKLSLWGNRCDLFLSTGVVDSQTSNPLNTLKALEKEMLIDDSEQVYKLVEANIQKPINGITVIDIILDNSGYELFSDLCLAAFLTEKKIANKVRFYVKRYPWFQSDVTLNDFKWMISQLEKSDVENIKQFGNYCKKYLDNSLWTIEEESFWTEPFDYSEMKKENPSLYSKLSEAILIIIKGDLNYSKLFGDIKWNYTTTFIEGIREFKPTNFVCLRTVKSDVCLGLPNGKAESLYDKDSNWWATGNFGVVQSFIKVP